MGVTEGERVKEASFQMFLKEVTERLFLFERVESSKEQVLNNRKNWKNVYVICELYGQKWEYEET